MENHHTATAQHIIHNDKVYHELESSNLTITAKLLSHVKQKLQSDRDVMMKQINDDTDDPDRNIGQLQDTMNSLKTSKVF